MASLRDIRKRIRSVQSTQKITRAMKLVSAAKLRKAQSSIVAARPYALTLQQVINGIVARAETTDVLSHPLLDIRTDIKRVLIITVTSDRGMCGAFNSNIIRRTERLFLEKKNQFEVVEVGSIGKRGRDYFTARKIPLGHDFSHAFEKLNFASAQQIANQISQEFITQKLDAVFFVYNQFKSAMTQIVTVEQLLPIATQPVSAAAQALDYTYEPSKQALLEDVLPRYLATQVWRILLESVASEHGARMSAMEAATKNATEMIEGLTLVYNRARQAGITKELIEIISGADAQKG